jgi:MFS family permease
MTENVVADRDNRQRGYALRTNGSERSMLPMTRASTTQIRIGFIGVAIAFATALAFTTLPAPLWSLYAQRDNFSSLMIAVVFAAYAVGVALSLFLVGHISDWYGRRRVVLPALLLNVGAGIVFLLWPALPGLLVARVISGLGISGQRDRDGVAHGAARRLRGS